MKVAARALTAQWERSRQSTLFLFVLTAVPVLFPSLRDSEGNDALSLGLFGSDLVLNLAYIALFASAFAPSIVSLRWALITANIAFIVYGSLAGITSMVVWNVIIGSMQSFNQFKLLRARAKVALTDEHRRFRQMLFPDLDDLNFSALWALGTTTAVVDEQVTFAGRTVETVHVVLDGVVEMHKGDAVVERLPTGSLVGEMSYLSGGPATADCFAVGEVTLHAWPQRSLRSLAEFNPAADRAMSEAISLDLNRKLSWRTFWA